MIDSKKYILRQVNFKFLVKLEKTSSKASILLSDTYAANIIGFIKKQRLNWLGHVERMAEDNIVQKIKILKPMSK